MNKVFLLISILILFLVSCKSNSKSNQSIQKIGKTLESGTTINETPTLLKYTTGIREIFEDSKGSIWIGSGKEGVCRYDGSTFTYFSKEDGLSHNQVRAIHEDENGLIWFECGHGLSYYDGEKIKTITKKDYSSKKDWKKSKNHLWFKGDETYGYNELEQEPGLYRYHNGELTFLSFPVPPHKYAHEMYSVTTKTKKEKKEQTGLAHMNVQLVMTGIHLK